MSTQLRKGYWRISTGGLKRWIKAPTATKAFAKFLNVYHPKSLGQIVELYGAEVDDPEHLAYASTMRLLKDLGRWSD